MGPEAKLALEKILSLRQITRETSTQTSRSQSKILQRLQDADLTDVSLKLARHKREFGW